MSIQAISTEYLYPEPWIIEGERGLTFKIGQDENGYYAHSEVKKIPEVVEYDNRFYHRTGWNSDRGEVYYKETKKELLAKPAMRNSDPGAEVGVLAMCRACGDAARHSFCQEVRQGLHVRGLWAPKRESDLITAIFKAIEDAKLTSS